MYSIIFFPDPIIGCIFHCVAFAQSRSDQCYREARCSAWASRVIPLLHHRTISSTNAQQFLARFVDYRDHIDIQRVEQAD